MIGGRSVLGNLLPTLLLLLKVQADNPFSSNVVALTARNWRKEVEDYPHAVFVNICRNGWGYCQQLTPEWEKLAKAVKGTVKIAYWDTEQRDRPPALLGEYKGTPTIRYFKPKKKQQPGSNKKKTVLDYNYERKAKDMKSFTDREMPNFIESVANGRVDLAKFEDKAIKNGLPRAMLFTSKPNTSSISKFLSTEFRRRMIIAEIKPTKKNKEIIDQFQIEDFPALIVILPPSNSTTGEEEAAENSVIIRYPGKETSEFSKHRLITFLTNHALKDMVMPKRKETEDSTGDPSTPQEESKPAKKDKVKSEL